MLNMRRYQFKLPELNFYYGTLLFKRLMITVVCVLYTSVLSPMSTSLYGGNLSVTTISTIGLGISIVATLQIFCTKFPIKILTAMIVCANSIVVLGCGLYLFGIITPIGLITTLIVSFAIDHLAGGLYLNKLESMISKVYVEEYENFLHIKSFLAQVTLLVGSGLISLASYLGGLQLVLVVDIIIGIISIFTNIWSYRGLVELETTIATKSK